jgi:hypothetical protein
MINHNETKTGGGTYKSALEIMAAISKLGFEEFYTFHVKPSHDNIKYIRVTYRRVFGGFMMRRVKRYHRAPVGEQISVITTLFIPDTVARE